ncbi:MAG: F-type H+-transporting ATPase subunit a, partial [Frankiales bacterium]|nr:F-type H+-transporting ATPase subunit a [Frankiales bacterium]
MTAIAAGKGFEAPGPSDFVFSPLFGKGTVLTKPMLIMIVGSILVGAFFYLAARRSRVVPGKLQYAGEAVYGFVRNSIAGEAIGHGSRKFVPYLATLFAFIFIGNIAGIIPLVDFPATSKFAFPLFLAILSCLIFNYVGIRRV